ncbi:putative zinc finger CCCH domain-containing protein 13 isoform X2 [Apostichopus japonicus]|uniref:Putative zinc finger CCCH domain-containing protein 13 isoform X2 n=1 Tax=Stichopus japonicus TaxID=307972 RepID=A0A2G8LHE3_STIJA|nr:putative zinc finger CCCH domain-containing protein 13 isoform X2 [Apostichopus japonicus]
MNEGWCGLLFSKDPIIPYTGVCLNNIQSIAPPTAYRLLNGEHNDRRRLEPHILHSSAKKLDFSDNSYQSDLSDNDVELPQTPSGASRNGTRAKRGKAVKKPPSPYHNKSASKQGRNRTPSASKKNPREVWLENLRAGGNGLTGASKSSNYMGTVNRSFKPGNFDSSSDYLKETVLGMPPKRRSRGNTIEGVTVGRNQKGVPTYKPPEDMYDDILDLKKQVNALSSENDRLKARNRRLEDEHIKKEKQIEQLLDPTQGDLRLTLSSRQPDAAAKMSSLKQKNLKLEMALKDKEAELTKLQGDLKSTKIEEMKVAMESFYSEVQRLRHQLSTNGAGSMTRSGRQGTGVQDQNMGPKIKALNSTILRLTESNQRLQSENKLLKTDLERALQAGDSTDEDRNSRRSLKHRDYEDMNRKQLLRALAQLEEERKQQARERNQGVTERDARRTKKVTRGIKRREKRTREENKSRPRSPSSESLRSQRSSRKSASRSGSQASLRKKEREEEKWRQEQEKKAEQLRLNRSARSIQKNWRAHRNKLKEDEEDVDEVVSFVNIVKISVLRKPYNTFVAVETQFTCMNMYFQWVIRQIYQLTAPFLFMEKHCLALLRWYSAQASDKHCWCELQYRSMTDSEAESVHSNRSRASSVRTATSASQRRLDSDGDSDDDVVITPSSSRKGSHHGSRPSSAHSSSKKSSGRKSKGHEEVNGHQSNSSENDVMDTPTRRRFMRD